MINAVFQFQYYLMDFSEFSPFYTKFDTKTITYFKLFMVNINLLFFVILNTFFNFFYCINAHSPSYTHYSNNNIITTMAVYHRC